MTEQRLFGHLLKLNEIDPLFKPDQKVTMATVIPLFFQKFYPTEMNRIHYGTFCHDILQDFIQSLPLNPPGLQ